MTITITTGVQTDVPGAEGQFGEQIRPWISALTGGDYLVTWITADGVFGQLYDASGDTTGASFQVDTPDPSGFTLPVPDYPATAAPLSDGGFVVTWTDAQTGNFIGTIHVQRFDANGDKVGGDTQISSFGNNTRDETSVVAGLKGGGYVVAWASSDDNNQDVNHIYAEQFDASGAAVGAQFEVNTDTTHDQENPSIAALADGGYILTWATAGEATQNGSDIYTQRYNASGQKVGGETLVTTPALTLHAFPSVTALANGGYVIAWQGVAQDGSWDVYVQAFTSAGAAIGQAVMANTTVAGNQTQPTVVATSNGGWFVAWTSDQSGGGIYGQAFDASGAKVGAETLEPLTAGQDQWQAATVLANGHLALVWAMPDGSGNWNVVQNLVGTTTVSPDLTTAVETAIGDGANDTFFAAPGTINPGDRIDGGGGTNTLQLTAAQTANFTGVTITNVQEILGSSGNDTLIFPQGPPAGVTFNTGGGHDTLDMGGQVDLSTLSLSGTWTLGPAPGAFADFTLTSVSQIAEISGAGGDLTVDATGLTLTSAQTAQLLNQGVSTILEKGVTYRLNASMLIGDSQIQIATTTAGASTTPSIAQLAGGEMVAVFAVAPPAGANGPAIAFELLDPQGNPIGGAVTVDGAATQDQLPSVAALTGGGFVVTWQGSDPTHGYANSNYLQAFDSQGHKVGGLVTLATNTVPHVTALTGGGYVVVGQSNTGADIGFQAFGASGSLVASGAAGSTTSGVNPMAAGLSGGGFVVAWLQPGAEVDFQLYNAAGAAVGSQQSIAAQVTNAANAGDGNMTVAGLTNGGFVLTWSAFSDADHGWDLYAERFDASGAAQGGVVQVNASSANQVGDPVVAATSDGGYIISWTMVSATGTDPEVMAQLYNSAGQPVGPPASVGSSATGQGVGAPAVAGLSHGGGYVIAYTGVGFGVTQELVTVTQGVDAILTTGVDTFHGGNSNLLVLTPSGGLNAGDVVTGGTGQNELEMTSAGTLDFTAPTTFSGFQTIFGSSGADTFVFSTPRLAGVTRIDGAGGTNTIVATDSQLNLGGVTLANIQALSTNFAGGTTFTLPASAGSLGVTGAAGFDQVDLGVSASSATFTHNANGTWTMALAGGAHDTLSGIELVQFSDRDVSLTARWANRGNFLGHSVSDFLIQNTAGAVVVGEVQSGQAGYSTVSALGPEWKFEGNGDFSGGGASSFLIENSAGAVDVGQVQSGAAHYAQVAALGPEWKFVGTGDYLGNARSEFLIENSAGAVVVADAGSGHAVYTTVAGLGTEWKFVGTGDFLGDGKDDFLIQNTSGSVVIGEVVNGAAAYTAVAGLGPEWKFVGTGDFLGEGHSQFLIENTSGAVDIGDWSGGQIHFTQVAGLGPEWKFVGTGDYLGEGHDQFLIENTSGAVDIGDWTGGQIHFTQIAGLGPEWSFH